eukprot:3895335-Prymnesium_polylepis.1
MNEWLMRCAELTQGENKGQRTPSLSCHWDYPQHEEGILHRTAHSRTLMVRSACPRPTASAQRACTGPAPPARARTLCT